MLGSILSSVGGSLGKYLGGGILSTIGRYAGKLVGNYLDNKSFSRTESTHKFTNIRDSFYISKAQYGSPIPLIFGKMRVDGKIIWSDTIIEKRSTNTTRKYFKHQKLTIEKQITNLEYYLNFAMAICEGEIAEIERVWFKDEIIDLSQYKFRLYKGDEVQIVDPLIASCKEFTTAYRGLAYIVFEQLPLSDFDDIIPNFSFEVIRKTNIKQDLSVEDLVKSMIMIPASGEYVYDTIIQTKTNLSHLNTPIATTNINSHNHYNIANSIYSLNQLQLTCKNIEWVSPVVCWFGNNIDAKECTIKPAIEFKDQNISYSEEWKVGGYNRNNAHEITKDNKQNPVYGGSVNDASIIRYLIEIKQRNLKIMFYPMFFLDVDQKPWRGRVTCESQYITEFFQKKHGYNEFILHYAELVKNHVDAFVIGSELIGLTKVRDGNFFPAVDELIKLAAKVKKIVGSNIKVTYAADWSEYHHTDGGWYNLDSLWASSDIDFIGIDAYFPITKSLSSDITIEEIINGFSQGEGYDYYIDYNDYSKHKIEPAYAWKNLRYWWENYHKNPDGKTTKWQPCSKQIWFTEFGFPSIDKAPNQPNVFYDPKCIDGGIPRYSNGNVDFSIQRKAIRAFIEYWKTQEYIGEMFLWTWDARPYPAWPHMKIWNDGHLWEKGHWVNNKFGLSNVASIILEISDKCGIDIELLDVSSLDISVEGFILNSQINGKNAINILRTSYFFDICTNKKGGISFEKRGNKKEINLCSTEFIKISDNNLIDEIEIPQEIALSIIDLYFINHHKEYSINYIYINNENNSYASNAIINLPITMTEYEAKNIGNLILKNAEIENRIIKFILPLGVIELKPTDFITLKHMDKKYSVRVINTEINYNQMIVIAIIDNKYNYLRSTASKEQLEIENNDNLESYLIILDLPIALEDQNTAYLAIYLRHSINSSLYAKLSTDLGNSWDKIANLKPTNSIGRVIDFHQNPVSNIFLIDEVSYILLNAYRLEEYSSENWQIAMVGLEIIQFKQLEKIDKNIYKISHIIRGCTGTEKYISQHRIGEDFAIIDYGINILPVSEKLENKIVSFKSCGIEKMLTYNNNANKPISPYIIEETIKDNKLYLKWIMRNKKNDDWQHADKFNSEINRNINFTITITDIDQIYQKHTKNTSIIIDISSFSLSDNYKIDIVVNNNMF